MTKADELRVLASRLEVPATVAIRLTKIAVELDQMAEALLEAEAADQERHDWDDLEACMTDREMAPRYEDEYRRRAKRRAVLRAAGYEVPQ